MTESNAPSGELLLYQTDDGRTRIECRFESDTLWLTQAQMAELFETTSQNITLHLREIYAVRELERKHAVAHDRVIANASKTVATFPVESYAVQLDRGVFAGLYSLNGVERELGGAL